MMMFHRYVNVYQSVIDTGIIPANRLISWDLMGLSKVDLELGEF
jgi:hypothetical protein